MKVCYIDQPIIGRDGMITALTERGCELSAFPAPPVFDKTQGTYDKELESALTSICPDCVFSFDFHPEVALVCDRRKVPYISWTVNLPAPALYGQIADLPCNHLYCSDSALCDELTGKGKALTYLPAACDPDQLLGVANSPMNDLPDMDVSYIGPDTAMEEESFLDHLAQKDAYAAGFIKALMDSQKLLYGTNLVEASLNPRALEALQNTFPLQLSPELGLKESWVYANTLINPAITDIERKEILDQVSVHLGNEANLHFFPDKVGNLAPYIYSKSLVNLVIPPRVLTTGIPMQAMEVMGSRGFLICGYQADLADAFVPGEEVVLFDSREDLLDKLTYYMEHGTERTAITKAALEKIRAEHTFAHRLDMLLQF